jgi:hypothetical protein
MIDVYIVRDPQGRVIGVSVNNHISALYDAYCHSEHSDFIPLESLKKMFEDKESAADSNFTLKREQVAL